MTNARPLAAAALAAALLRLGSLALAACSAPRDAPASTSPASTSIASSPAPAASTSARPLAAASAAPAGTATATAEARAAKVRAPGDLAGDTIDYAYDAKDVNDKTRAYEGRAFVPDAVVATGAPAPLVVFLHGLNRLLIPHRWMGGGTEGDVRRIVDGLVAKGAISPVILAGPGSIEKAAVAHGSSFPKFDFDRFVELTEAALPAGVKIDKARIVVTGHSGAGCSDRGGLVAALKARARPLAVVSIDTCMAGPLAKALGAAPESTHVVVTWQTASWSRDFDHFRAVFKREAAANPPKAGVLRELDLLPSLPKAHDATVAQTFEKWLPRLLGPGSKASGP